MLRRAWLAAFAAVMAVLGLVLPSSGCLNPRPEELPSSAASGDDVASPVRETCDDNPLLAECDLPDQDGVDSPTVAPQPEPTSGPDGNQPADEGDIGEVVDDQGQPLPDAGADGAASDAGAP